MFHVRVYEESFNHDEDANFSVAELIIRHFSN